MPRFYEFPFDYEIPACELCGLPGETDGLLDETARTVLIANAKGTPMSLVECSDCGLRFFSPRPKWHILKHLVAAEKAEAESLFRNGSFTPVCDPDQQKRNIRSYYEDMLDEVMAAASMLSGRSPSTLFEIGGSVGWLSSAAARRGVQSIKGCDLNPYAVEIARTEHGLSGFSAGDFGDYNPGPSEQYDLVVALDYLEHTYTPWADLRKISSMVRPGGLFLMKTFLDELDTRHEQLSPPSHAIHWTSPVLRAAIGFSGMTIRKWRLDYGGYQVIVIAHRPIAQEASQ